MTLSLSWVTPIDDLQVDVDGNFKLLYLEDGVYIEAIPGEGKALGSKTLKKSWYTRGGGLTRRQ